MVVRGRKLVDQASKRLDREGVEHGVIMAGHWRNQPNAKIQICSVDTLFERQLTPKADIVVIDEGHHATSQGYKWLAEAYSDAHFLPVTATPYCRGSLKHVAQEIVRPIKIKELIAQGFLVPPIYFAPSVPDLTGVSISSTGDYVIKELDRILNDTHPIGDVVESWKKLGQNRATLVFAVSINHSESMAKAFNDAGISAISVDADNSDIERQQAIDQLECGEIKIICNVGIFCTGIDIPTLSCLVMVRPTRSYSLYIQQAGRGTRISPDKKDFILIDHGGNVLRHGCILEDREGSLDPMPKVIKGKTDGLSQCHECFALFEKRFGYCPICGVSYANNPADIKDDKAMNPLDGKMEEANEFHLKVMARRGELRDIAKRKGYKPGWVYFKLREEFGLDVADKYQKKRNIPDFIKQKLNLR